MAPVFTKVSQAVHTVARQRLFYKFFAVGLYFEGRFPR